MTQKPDSNHSGPQPPLRSLVRGQVTQSGQPVARTLVEVYDVEMRDQKLIDKTTTDDEGRYRLYYSTRHLCRPRERGRANLQVRVVGAEKQLLAESDVRFNAGPEETIDLSLPESRNARSEYTLLVAAVTPALCGVPLPELKDEDAQFLARQTGFDAVLISRLAESARRHLEATSVAESTFYGLFRQDLPTKLADLLALDLSTLRDMLERSARDGIIPSPSTSELDEISRALSALKADQTLNATGETGGSSLGDLLGAAGLDPARRRIVAELQIQSDGSREALWQALRAHAEFTSSEVASVRFTMELGDLTGSHLPLVLELQRQAAGAEAGQYERGLRSRAKTSQLYAPDSLPALEVRMFAGLDVEDWKAILKRRQPDGEPIGVPANTPGENDEQRLKNYATSLANRAEEAAPTAAIAGRVVKDTASNSPFKTERTDLQRFFENNPQFDFKAEPVDMFLKEDRDEKLTGVDDRKALTTKLRSMQRIFNIAPKYQEMRTLLTDDLHSGAAIVRLGPRTFLNRYAEPLGGEARAEEIFRTASFVHTEALNLILTHSVYSRGGLPYAVGGEEDGVEPDPQPEPEAEAEGPTWSGIFGSMDLCDCEHCKSLYSPAAYFVDILRFLGDGPTKDNQTPLQVLLTLRPDLEHLELTCENTTTPLPYVDLAKEIMEAEVAARAFQIAEGADIATVLADLSARRMPTAFPAAFTAKGYPLTDKASVRPDRSGRTTDESSWMILDTGWAFSVRHQGQFEGFRVLAWPQTSWTAAELRAQPEHTHDAAYQVLRDAVYPWDLPLNLPVEESRTYLRHLGVPRHELLTTFFRGDPRAAWSSAAIAYDFLGLTPEAARIITDPMGATPPRPTWTCWGLQQQNNSIVDLTDGTAPPATGDWDEVLTRVSICLLQSGLRYDELLELLGTRFINPMNGTLPTLEIRAAGDHSPTTCVLSRLEIAVVDRTATEAAQRATIAAAFDRLHRFVRLWRALKWTARDLDKALTAFKPVNNGQPDLTPAFLIQLSHVERARGQFALPVVAILAWWADIDVAEYVDHLKDGGPIVPSLYTTLFSSRASAGQSLPANPAALTGSLDANATAIVAALRVSAADLALLQAHPNVVPRLPGDVVDDALTLKNLSLLYRHASLARALKLSIRNYLSTLDLLSARPFATTAATMEYVRQLEAVGTSGFSVEDLDYLLRHQIQPGSRVAIADEEIADLLDTMRVDLRAIADDHTFVDETDDPDEATSDPAGDLTRQRLALLNWSAAIVDQVVAVLNDTFTFSTRLVTLDPAVVIPPSLVEKVTYDAAAQQLRFTGTMSSAERTLLTAAPNTEQTFVGAVRALFNAPRAIVARHMSRFSVPTFEAPLTPLPANFRIPDALKDKYYYDSAAGRLRFVGVMTEAEYSLLMRDATDMLHRGAIDTLFNAPANTAPKGSDVFLTSTGPNHDIAALFGSPATTPQMRFVRVLRKLMPYLNATLSERAVTQRISEGLLLESSAASALLTRWIAASAQPTEFAISDFLAPTFAASNENIASTRTVFPDQFQTVRRLHKIAMMVDRFMMTTSQLAWLFRFGVGSWLDLNALSLVPIGAAHARYTEWARLADVCRLRDALPDGERLLTDVFTKARANGAQRADVVALLADRSTWSVADLNALCDTNGFNLSVTDFRTEKALVRLLAAFRALKRLGASAASCLTWTKDAPTYTELRTASRDIRSQVRARLDAAQWLEIAKSLHDPLRERQRSALVSYLAARRGLRSADELYAQLLIDVQMTPCMMTSRIKQAIASVQLFVQRSLMSLEDEVSMTPPDAREWSRWRKQYRVWEANRKVLLYPENWIEPELRDDKSQFFQELEDELLQNDVTADTAEDAFLHYLEKLDQVARLEVAGVYRQTENGAEIVHVIGRTHATPHVYFYRRLQNAVWSPWERVDLDIEGDHIMPVIWNRRLHLFWITFTEKTDTPTKEERSKNEDPRKYWEIKCAWSVFRHGKWVPKRISIGALPHPKYPYPQLRQEPKHFSFKTRFVPGPLGDQLSIECYGPKVTIEPAVTSTTQITENVQLIVDFVRHFVLGNLAPYWMTVQFRLNQTVPRAQDLATISVVVTRTSDGAARGTLTPDRTGETKTSSGSNYWVNEDISCELHSNAFAIYDVSAKWERFGTIPSIIGVTVDLVPWTPPPATTATVQPERVTASDMQFFGEFMQDDANGEVVAVPAGQAYRAPSPPQLLPITGTGIESMMQVENYNSTGALGKSGILAQTPGRAFRLLLSHDALQYFFDGPTGTVLFSYPFFFHDDRRTYAVFYIPSTFQSPRKLLFRTFFHPRVPEFMRAINRLGIDGLLTLDNQRLIDAPLEFTKYQPSAIVDSRWPKEDVDFSYGGAYSLYNWELFFHTPFLIAVQLTRNQRFEDAQKWFHYIFDPTATDSPEQKAAQPGRERFWRVKPFYDEALGGIETLEELMANSIELAEQVNVWRADPFKPHVIARLRIVAYMKAVVMRYIDNLIAWGDQLFRRDTIESINEATQLYVLAAQILGKRPERIPPRVTPQLQTFRTLDDYRSLDSLSNSVVAIESFLSSTPPPPVVGDEDAPIGPPLTMPFFCLTANDKLLGYWDTVADRLFKIRHCMNIQGVARELPLFEPPIDPALLVRAAAAGVDLASVLADINAPVPHYRFNVMLQKASELCGEVKSLGAALLSALEKRDSEALALLRSTHEAELLKAARAVKERQVEEAGHTLQGLMKSQDVVSARQAYYSSRPFINTFEKVHLALTTQSLQSMTLQAGAELLAGILHLIPGLKSGAPTTIGATYGGDNVGPAAQAFGSVAGTMASMMNTAASLSATLGSHQRRQDDWTHQADLATKELEQIKKQIAAAEVRSAITERELQNHDLQVENAKAEQDFMRDKFTNRELYGWMVGQIAGIYFKSYQLAYDVAKRAERTYRYELGLKDSNFIEFGYWDSLKKGLLAGERLHQDLRRMDVAYLDQNKREFEITKHVSLNALDPISVLKLKQTGECFVSLPEAIFDLDYPGHYLRRFKSVGVTIPCVVGPYASVNCTLTLHTSTIRHMSSLINNEYARQGDDDPRFTDSIGAVQTIVTSSAQNDSGIFEANLRDERYLPFEGKGVISTWRVQLPQDFPAFDHETISDVVLHFRYTARHGGEQLRKAAATELSAAVDAAVQSAEQQGLARSFSLRHEFPSDWHRFLNPPAGVNGDQAIRLNLEKSRFPFLLQSKPIALSRIRLFVKVKPEFTEDYVDEGEFNVSLQPGTQPSGTALSWNTWKGLVRADLETTGPLGDWTLAAWRQPAGATTHVRLDPGAIEDIIAVCAYTIAGA